MAQHSEFLGSTSSDLEMPEVPTRPVRDLLGVSVDAAAALSDLGVRRVFDLDSSNVFASARTVVHCARPCVGQPFWVIRGRPTERRVRGRSC